MPVELGRRAAIHGNGEFRGQSRSEPSPGSFPAAACAGAACGTRGFVRNVYGPANSDRPAERYPDCHQRGRPVEERHGDDYRHELIFLAVTGPVVRNRRRRFATYMATLTPAANSNPSRVISWSVAGTGCTGAACGTISSSGVYTAPSAPPSPATVQIIATPLADPSKAASVSVSILSGDQRFDIALRRDGGARRAQAFQATVTGAQDATVTWDVNGVVGGNSAHRNDLEFANGSRQHDIHRPANTAGGRIGDRACAQQRGSEYFRERNDHVHGRHQRNANAGERDARHRRTANIHRPGQQHAESKRGMAGERIAGGNLGGRPDLRNGIESVPADFDQQRRERRLHCARRSAISQSGQDHGHESSGQRAKRFGSVTILPHIIVSVQPGNAALAGTGQLRFTATVNGTENQQVIWSVTGAGCGSPRACGSIDSTGLYTAPAVAAIARF